MENKVISFRASNECVKFLRAVNHNSHGLAAGNLCSMLRKQALQFVKEKRISYVPFIVIADCVRGKRPPLDSGHGMKKELILVVSDSYEYGNEDNMAEDELNDTLDELENLTDTECMLLYLRVLMFNAELQEKIETGITAHELYEKTIKRKLERSNV